MPRLDPHGHEASNSLMYKAVGWDQIRGTRLRVGERRPTATQISISIMVGLRSLRDLVPPYDNALA